LAAGSQRAGPTQHRCVGMRLGGAQKPQGFLWGPKRAGPAQQRCGGTRLGVLAKRPQRPGLTGVLALNALAVVLTRVRQGRHKGSATPTDWVGPSKFTSRAAHSHKCAARLFRLHSSLIRDQQIDHWLPRSRLTFAAERANSAPVEHGGTRATVRTTTI